MHAKQSVTSSSGQIQCHPLTIVTIVIIIIDLLMFRAEMAEHLDRVERAFQHQHPQIKVTIHFNSEAFVSNSNVHSATRCQCRWTTSQTEMLQLSSGGSHSEKVSKTSVERVLSTKCLFIRCFIYFYTCKYFRIYNTLLKHIRMSNYIYTMLLYIRFNCAQFYASHVVIRHSALLASDTLKLRDKRRRRCRHLTISASAWATS